MFPNALGLPQCPGAQNNTIYSCSMWYKNLCMTIWQLLCDPCVMWKSNNILSVNAKMLKIAGLFRSFLITKFMVKDTFQCNIYRLTSVIFLYTADQKTAQTFLTTAVDLYGTLSAGVTPSVPSKNIYFVHSIWRLISP